jgi:hypothetical protein
MIILLPTCQSNTVLQHIHHKLNRDKQNKEVAREFLSAFLNDEILYRKAPIHMIFLLPTCQSIIELPACSEPNEQVQTKLRSP